MRRPAAQALLDLIVEHADQDPMFVRERYGRLGLLVLSDDVLHRWQRIAGTSMPTALSLRSDQTIEFSLIPPGVEIPRNYWGRMHGGSFYGHPIRVVGTP